MKKIILYPFPFLNLLLLLLFPLLADARWATLEDAALETKSYKLTINIKKDGTSDEVHESERLVKNEAGREAAAKKQIVYNSNTSKIKVLAASTTNNGKEYKVSVETIEDKPLASTREGFDQSRQILVAFPKVEIGSLVRLKHRLENHVTPVKDNYSNEFQFGLDSYCDKSDIIINSEIELQFKANDPEKALEIKQSRKGKLYIYEVHQTKPIFKQIINERSLAADPKNYTYIYFSSFKSWNDVAKTFTEGYEKVLSEPLPELYGNIVAGASKEKTFVDKANYIMSQLNEHVIYHGDWQSVKGQFIPRKLSDVASTHYGDCKDFSTGTAAMLRNLGFKANVAVVYRDNNKQYDDGLLLPTFHAFNHAIIRAEDENGKVYWLDPTNNISMAQGIFPDIADRVALPLSVSSNAGVGLERIPNINHEHAYDEIVSNISFDDMTANFAVKLDLRGENALSFVGAEMYMSRKNLESEIYRILNENYLDEEDKKSISFSDLKSRIAKDVTINAQYLRRNFVNISNLGRAFTLKGNWVSPYLAVSADQVGDLKTGNPTTLIVKSILKDVKAKNIKSLEVKIDSPWVIAERKCNEVGKDIEIIDNIKIIKDYISNSELKSEEFINLKKNLQKRFQNTAVVFE